MWTVEGLFEVSQSVDDVAWTEEVSFHTTDFSSTYSISSTRLTFISYDDAYDEENLSNGIRRFPTTSTHDNMILPSLEDDTEIFSVTLTEYNEVDC